MQFIRAQLEKKRAAKLKEDEEEEDSNSVKGLPKITSENRREDDEDLDDLSGLDTLVDTEESGTDNSL